MAALSWEGRSPVLVSGVLPALAAPLGALAGLWRYYQPGCGGRVELSALLEGILCRKRPAQGRDWAVCSAGFRHWRCAACPSAVPGYWPVLPPRREAPGSCPGWWFCWPCGCSAGLWGERRRDGALPCSFCSCWRRPLLGNLPNLIPAVKLVLLDAFDRSRFLFSLSGAGLAAALQAGGGRLRRALLRTLSAREEGPSFAHPAQAAFYGAARAAAAYGAVGAGAPVSVRPAGP